MTSISAFAQKTGVSTAEVQQPLSSQTENTGLWFPLEKDVVLNYYSYIIDLNDERVRRMYAPLFAKYHLEFSGYVWERVLNQIMQSADKELLENVFIRSEPKMIGFIITKYKLVPRFPAFLAPILSDPKTFEEYLKISYDTRVNKQ
jgi:hypothetical protein